MIKIKFSDDGLWYTLSHKNEKVYHFFRIGKTEFDGLKIYEIQLWKMSISWGVYVLK